MKLDKKTLLLFLVLFIFVHLTRIFIGFGICDTGNLLSRQQELIFFGHLRGISAVTFLSDLIGGIWMWLWNPANLITLRLGAVLLNCLNAFLVILLIRDILPKSHSISVIFVSLTLLVLISPYELLINYLTVPSLLLTLGIYLIHKYLIRINAGSFPRWNLAGIGLVLAALVCARISMAALAGIGLMGIPLLANRINFNFPSKRLRILLWLSVGFITFFLLMTVILVLMGLHKEFLDSLFFTFSNRPDNDVSGYTLQQFLPQYIDRGFKAFLLAAIFSTIALGTSWIAEKYRVGWLNYLIYSSAMVGLYLIHTNGPYQAQLRFREILLGLVIILSILAWLRLKLSPHARILLVAGILGAVIMPLGSTQGLQTTTYGLWFILPFSILIFGEFEHRISWFSSLQPAPLALAGSMVCLLVLLLANNLKWQDNLSANFIFSTDLRRYHTKQLAYIFDDPSMVKEIDRVARLVHDSTRPGETCLFFNHIAGFYWLSGTKSFLYSHNIYGVGESEKVVAIQLADALKKGKLPQLCVLYIPDSDDRMPLIYKDQIACLDMVRKLYAGKQGMTKILESQHFEVYRDDLNSRQTLKSK